MTLGARLKTLRQEIGLSQEALGAQGFVSTPGWIKIENGQRQASEKLIVRLIGWLVREKYVRVGASEALKEELLVLKYLGSTSRFVREMAAEHAKTMSNGPALIAGSSSGSPQEKPRRGRPRASK